MRDRLLVPLLRRLDLAGGDLPEAQRRRGGRDQHAVARGARGGERRAAHGERLVEVQLVDPVDGQLDLERGGRGRRAVGELVPRADQAPVGVLVAAEPVLDGGAARGQLDPVRRRLGREPLERLEQRRAALLELAERAQRLGQLHAQLDLAVAVLRGQQAQRGGEPVHGGGRRPCRGRRARLSQQRDRAVVARARRLLDVMGALGRAGAALGQRLGGPRVGRDAAARGHRAVDRAAHERVAEHEAARDRRHADEVEREQAVERRQPVAELQLRRPPPRGRPRTARRRRRRRRAAVARWGRGRRAPPPARPRRPAARRRPRRRCRARRRAGGRRASARAARGRTGCRRRGGRWRPRPPGPRRRAARRPRPRSAGRA